MNLTELGPPEDALFGARAEFGMNIQVSVTPRSIRVIQPGRRPIVHPRLVREWYEELVQALQGAQPLYEKSWRIVYAAQPVIAFHLLGPDGQARFGLLLDASNLYHTGLGVTLTDIGFTQTVRDLPRKPSDDGREHLVFNQWTGRAWFCVPGTDEYHRHMSDADPYDRVRGTTVADPIETIMACVRNVRV